MPLLQKNHILNAWALALCGLLVLSGACKSSDKNQTKNQHKSVATSQPPSDQSGQQHTKHKKTTSAPTRAVTKEIAQGIEKHIETKSAAEDGFFSLTFKDKELRLKLVRIHIEYLASLGVNENFACVDLVDTEGDVYDVDFFLNGPPGDMTVTETTVHKINGQPFYAWKQLADKTWERIPMDKASAKHQGVIEGKDTFEFRYSLTLPTLEEPAQMWLPLPITDSFQTVDNVSITVPGKQTTITEQNHANKILMLDLEPKDSGATIDMRFAVTRKEKGSYKATLKSSTDHLEPDLLIPATPEMKALGEAAIKGKKTDLIRARALYDHVMDRMAYKKVGNEYGNGDATYACDSRSGNCSDYHSYFIAISRAVGIPARFGVGAAIPSSRDEGNISGYHCWAEFYADGKWWPIDVSEGDKYSNLSSYYFGHHPANRIELSRGRDLIVEPGPQSGPINFLAHPVLEVGGKNVRIKANFSFTRASQG